MTTPLSFINSSQKSSTVALSASRVELHSFYSKALGIYKNYYIYLPEGYHLTTDHYPVIFYLRGHEREWFNPTEDSTRNGRTLKEVADDLIQQGKIGKMLLVGISTASADNKIPCLGVNMLKAKSAKSEGIGNGRFEDYIIQDLITHIDANFRTTASSSQRGIDGFSLGGYTSVMLSIKHPDCFSSVGAYDGTFMWYNFDDLRRSEPLPDDYTWVKTEFFSVAFDTPRDIDYMKSYNPINLLMEADSVDLKKIQRIRFHILSAAYDGNLGNIERAEHLIEFFSKKGIQNSFGELSLTPSALHDWFHANLYAEKVLVKHWETFSSNQD